MFGALLTSMRPHQWVKNLFCVAPLAFSKNLNNLELALLSGAALAIFSVLSSSVYLVNDLFDIEKDREHPTKRHRPIPSGRLPIGVARGAAAVLIMVALGAAFPLGYPFFSCAAGYLILNLAYSLALKHVPFVDVLSIASGFLLRVFAGALAINVPASPWLLACTFVLASYLGFGKRAHELASAEREDRVSSGARPVLAKYRLKHLIVILWLLAAATCVLYGAYTLSPKVHIAFGTERLVWTTPFAIFGVVRFAQLTAHRKGADSPTDAMLRDLPFVLNLVAWVAAVVLIIYVI
ncbi:MAG: UbiA prenyltransferase family protein [Myxococcales bacterium]|nr:UbiA prenyltransferase family protein [Myxococcales bacterium]